KCASAMRWPAFAPVAAPGRRACQQQIKKRETAVLAGVGAIVVKYPREDYSFAAVANCYPREVVMKLSNLLLPTVTAIILVCSANAFADALDDEWKNLEDLFASPSPPTMASDCAKYTTDSANAECMDYVNKKPTFTYRTTAADRTGADTAAIRYCTRM